MKKKRVILSAGGTGGHLFPAQALAESLTDCEVLFVAGGLTFNRFFDRERFDFHAIASATFSFRSPFQIVRGARQIMRGMRQSRQILHAFQPDLVVGFGSFHTLPLLLTAKQKGIPILLHEQNAASGKVNRLFSRFACKSALTFPETAAELKGATEVVQFPIRTRQSEDPWSYFGLEKGRPTLLVFGGSQGAERLNAVFYEALPQLQEYQVLHFTGSEERGGDYPMPHCVKPFESKMHLAMEIADLAITRAGAGTLAELIASETPAILVPYPHATDDHQAKNAASFPGGELLLERDLTPERLARAIKAFPIEEKTDKIRISKQNTALRTLADVVRESMS